MTSQGTYPKATVGTDSHSPTELFHTAAVSFQTKRLINTL